MSKKPETVFKERIWPRLQELPNSFWEKIQQESIRGTLDYIGCVNGMYIALELKVGDNELDELQKWKRNKIIQSKGIAIRVHPDNWETVYGVLQKLAEGGRLDGQTKIELFSS